MFSTISVHAIWSDLFNFELESNFADPRNALPAQRALRGRRNLRATVTSVAQKRYHQLYAYPMTRTNVDIGGGGGRWGRLLEYNVENGEHDGVDDGDDE